MNGDFMHIEDVLEREIDVWHYRTISMDHIKLTEEISYIDILLIKKAIIHVRRHREHWPDGYLQYVISAVFLMAQRAIPECFTCIYKNQLEDMALQMVKVPEIDPDSIENELMSCPMLDRLALEVGKAEYAANRKVSNK